MKVATARTKKPEMTFSETMFHSEHVDNDFVDRNVVSNCMESLLFERHKNLTVKYRGNKLKFIFKLFKANPVRQSSKHKFHLNYWSFNDVWDIS